MWVKHTINPLIGFGLHDTLGINMIKSSETPTSVSNLKSSQVYNFIGKIGIDKLRLGNAGSTQAVTRTLLT